MGFVDFSVLKWNNIKWNTSENIISIGEKNHLVLNLGFLKLILDFLVLNKRKKKKFT